MAYFNYFNKHFNQVLLTYYLPVDLNSFQMYCWGMWLGILFCSGVAGHLPPHHKMVIFFYQLASNDMHLKSLFARYNAVLPTFNLFVNGVHALQEWKKCVKYMNPKGFPHRVRVNTDQLQKCY